MERVPHIGVAMHAGEGLVFRFCCNRRLMDEIRMAVHACRLGHAPVTGLDLNGVVIVFQRKGQRVKEAVVGFHEPLGDRVVRQVTIVADGNVLMAGMLPRVVMALHHVAVRATLGIVAQVTCALAVAERERSKPGDDTNHDDEGEREVKPPSRPAK